MQDTPRKPISNWNLTKCRLFMTHKASFCKNLITSPQMKMQGTSYLSLNAGFVH